MSDLRVNSNIIKRIAIVDDYNGVFSKTSMDINNDGVKELFHGHKVEGVFRAGIPDKDIPEIKRYLPHQALYGLNEISKKNTDDIHENDIKYVNYSEGEHFNFKLLSGMSEKEITTDNIHKNTAVVKNSMFPHQVTAVPFLEKTAKHSKLTIPAGNRGPNFLNINTVAEGTIAVGGEITPGVPHPKSGKNTLVKNWQPIFYEGDLLKDKSGKPIGYDVHTKGEKGDGKADIIFGNKEGQVKISGTNQPIEKIAFKGTSYSAPAQLREEYLKDLKG